MGSEYQGNEQPKKSTKQNNVLSIYGNEGTMNLNPLILTNIQGSIYFKVSLFKLKTYHEVVDEIYYQVKHLEPWERGSRKTAGQTGMCGGVRGVGAGGIVSSAFCLLYKLYTLRLTRKQLNGLLQHTDSPYIRGLGFMYIRFTQPPGDLFTWYEPYLQDEEEIDVKAGGGQVISIGQMLKQWLTKLDWFSVLFPRIPVPIQKQIETKLNEYAKEHGITFKNYEPSDHRHSNPESSTRDRYDDRGSRNYAGTSEKRDYPKYDNKYRDRERERERDHYSERRKEKEKDYRVERRDRSRERNDRYKDYDYDKDKYNRDKHRGDRKYH